MDNPVDNIVDLGLVNYIRHPDNPNYIVFRFADEERAASFEKALSDEGIWFEKGSEQGRVKMFTLFGIHKNDFKRVEKINYLVEAKHKKPFIPSRIFRYFVLGIGITVMTLAILGYCERQKTLDQIESNTMTEEQTR